MPTLAQPEVFKATAVEVFPAGFHTSNNGTPKTWTLSELQEAANSYNEVVGTKHDAPIVLGHKGSTAYGWIERAFVDGDRLKFDIACNDKDFAEGVNTRKHPKRSVSFYPREHPNNPTPGRLNINHLAFLPTEGEINPAVKGLADFKFSDTEDDGLITVSFAEGEWYSSALSAVHAVMTKWRESVIERDGVDAADMLVPRGALEAIALEMGRSYVPWEEFYRQIEDVMQAIAQVREVAMLHNSSNYSEVDMATKPKTDEATNANEQPAPSTAEVPSAPTVSVEEFSELKSQLAALKLQVDAKDAAIAQLEATNAANAKALERSQVENFVEGLVSARKVLPAERDATVQELLWLPNTETVEFSEAGQTVQKTPRQARMDRLSNGRELWGNSPLPISPADAPNGATEDYAEVVRVYGDELSTDSLKDDQRIRAYCAKNGKDASNTADYAEAMTALGINY